MSDKVFNVFDLDIPEVIEPTPVEDKFESAFKFCILGLGQGGSKIAEAFYDMGYRRVFVANTSQQDLSKIKLPDDCKLHMDMGEGGAGKNRMNGVKAAKQYQQDLFDKMHDRFGTEADKILIVFGAGGGTGTGAAPMAIKIAREFAMSVLKHPRPARSSVGVLMTLPKQDEGAAVFANAHASVTQMLTMAERKMLAPLVVFDNSRLTALLPDVPVAKFYHTANRFMLAPLHVMNLLAGTPSEYASFDKSDFETVLNAGLAVFGLSTIPDTSSKTSISARLKDNFYVNLLSSDFDLSTSTHAAVLAAGSNDVMEEVPQTYIDYAFETVGRKVMENAMLHQGIYEVPVGVLTVYSAVSGLKFPVTRLQQLKLAGHVQ